MKTSSAFYHSIISEISRVGVLLCIPICAITAHAAVCTYDDGWDTVPTSAEDDIVIVSGNLSWTAALPTTVGCWTQSGGTVTFQTVYGTSGFTNFCITGNAVLSGGSWKHRDNGSVQSPSYRLWVEVGGDLTVGTDASISADGLGAAGARGKRGASHGGRGSGDYDPFGCYYAPVDTGVGGEWGGAPGGAIRIVCAGKLTNNGVISANATGNNTYAPSGGSVWITAGSIEGTGTLSANSAGTSSPGAGGRIAVILTGAGSDFSDYDIVTLASATVPSNDAACGTIYAETAADTQGEGWLILKGRGTLQSSNRRYSTPFTPSISSVKLAKLTLTNNVYCTVEAGQTLDISEAVVMADDVGSVTANGLYINGGNVIVNGDRFEQNFPVQTATAWMPDTDEWVIGGRGALTVSSELTFAGDLTVKDSCRMTISAPLRVGGNVRFLDTVTVTTTGANSNPGLLGIFAGGTFEIAEGVVITADGLGLNGTYPNTGGVRGGGAHGGCGGGLEFSPTPFDSVCEPTLAGTQGEWYSGGGIIRLSSGGLMTLNGSVTANGNMSGNTHCGAGGSVWITAGDLCGTNTSSIISANGGKEGGGGRIAVTLTGAGTDFNNYPGKIQARGNSGGAGTVYLRKNGEAIGEGTLLIDGTGSAALTTVIGAVDGETVGNVIITNMVNNSKVKLADGATITVTGDWLNYGTFVAGAGSTVIFAGANSSVYRGSTTFDNVGFDAPGKTMLFLDGARMKITGTASFSGMTGNALSLLSETDETTWTLDGTGAAVSLTDVDLKGCHSVTELTDINGHDLGGNENVTFIEILPGQEIVWTGASDTSWGNAANWDRNRTPIATDNVTISGSCANNPSLPFAVTVLSLTIQPGATLDLEGLDLNVTGNLSVGGTLIAGGSPAITVGGNLSVGGSLSAGSSTFVLNGSSQSVSAAADVSFYDISATSESLAFTTSLTAHGLTLGDGESDMDVTFARNAVFTLNGFTVQGNTATKNVTLATDGGTGSWILKSNNSTVSGVTVSGSDASQGVTVVVDPAECVNAGGNSNWLFGDSRIHWNGSIDTDFSNAANWDGGKVPGVADLVVIEGAKHAVIGGETAIGALTLGLGATVTVNAPLSVDGSLLVESNGTLIDNAPITVNGSVALMEGAVITHDGPTESSTQDGKHVDITCSGDFNINVGAAIDASDKGFAARYYLGGNNSSDVAGGVHAGRSENYWGGTSSVLTYGSIKDPVTLGSGGFYGSGAYAGGGVVRLVVGGKLTVNGAIKADSQNINGCTGAGGSVNLTAGTIEGSAAISANGGRNDAGDSQANSSGGRIAVKLTATGADFSDYDTALITAYGGYNKRNNRYGGTGTIYLKTGSQSLADGGTLLLKPKGTTRCATPIDGQGTRVKLYDELVVLGTARVQLGADVRIGTLSLTDDGQLQLNGNTIRVMTRCPKTWPKTGLPENVIVGTDPENPGDVKWNTEFLLMLR